MAVPPPMSEYNEQERHMMLRIQALEEALDRLVIPLCVVISWIIANLTFVVILLIGAGVVVSLLFALLGFVAAFMMFTKRLTRPRLF